MTARPPILRASFEGLVIERPRRITRHHGLSRLPEYRAWQTLRLRCLEPSHPAYPNYGGRGIMVCDRWRDSIEAFIADMRPKRSPRHELERRKRDDHREEAARHFVFFGAGFGLGAGAGPSS